MNVLIFCTQCTCLIQEKTKRKEEKNFKDSHESETNYNFHQYVCNFAFICYGHFLIHTFMYGALNG